MMRYFVSLALLLMFTACGGPPAPSGPALVVYATLDDPANLSELFVAFTAQTGIPVAANWGDSLANTEAVIGNRGLAADVLITTNVADIWRAGERGALRPLHGDAFAAVHNEFKDPDALWVALQRRVVVIAIPLNSQKELAGGYAALAGKMYRDQLCLSSIENSSNQSMIAMLIEDLGLKPAERVVRGWMMNMAVPPFATEALLVAALESGICKLGIISGSAAAVGIKNVEPVPAYYGISAMGVGRHANNPERAQQLIDWLILNKPVGGALHSNGRNIGVAGWRNEDVLLLAERVGYN